MSPDPLCELMQGLMTLDKNAIARAAKGGVSSKDAMDALSLVDWKGLLPRQGARLMDAAPDIVKLIQGQEPSSGLEKLISALVCASPIAAPSVLQQLIEANVISADYRLSKVDCQLGSCPSHALEDAPVLLVALAKKNFSAAQALLESGADPCLTAKNSESAFSAICAHWSSSVAKVEWEIAQSKGSKVPLWEMLLGKIESVRPLTQKELDDGLLNAVTNFITDQSFLKELLERGARPGSQEFAQSPMVRAIVCNGHEAPRILELFCEYGPDLVSTDKAIEAARNMGRQAVVRQLEEYARPLRHALALEKATSIPASKGKIRL